MKQNLFVQNPVEEVAGKKSFRGMTLRTRLFIAFALLSILPLFMIGSVATLISSQGLRDTAFDELHSVATLKESEIHDWLQVLQTNLGLIYENQLIDQGIFALLQHNQEQMLDQGQLSRELTEFNDRTGYFVEIFVMDQDGSIILSTDSSQEGKIQANKDFFQNGLIDRFVSPPAYEVSLNNYSIVLSEPITTKSDRVVGVLSARVNLSTLNGIMKQQTGLGEAGETYLVSSSFAALTELKNTNFALGKTYVRTQGVTEAIKTRAKGSAAYTDYAGNATFGVYQWIPELQVALVAEHRQDDALAASNRVLQVSIGLVIVISLLALGIAFLLTRAITGPITNLVEVADNIAQGNFELQARVSRRDEIGLLAQAFNRMTAQLRDFITSLEQRVQERTQALSSVAEVSTAASTVLETDKLLQQVVDLTKERFAFYHAHIYLLNEAGDTLVLASGAGEPGHQMVAEGRSIPLNREQSLVARAAREKKGVTANDVTTEPDFLPNPLLPDTRSELAVPMMIGEKVIGVFDVQSEVVGRFTDADIAVQTTLASQVASAVQNSRLYTQAEITRQEAQSLVDYAAEGIAVLDLTTGLFTSANKNAEELYGLTHEELLKVGPAQMSPAKQPDGRDSDEKALEMINLAMQTGFSTFEWVHVNAQGNSFPCEVHLVRLPGDQPRVRVSILDITERQRLQDLTAQRARQQEAINLITQRIQTATTIEAAMQVAARELGQALGEKPTLVTLNPSVLAGNGKDN